MIGRLWIIFRNELTTNLKRPMVWVCIFMLGFLHWGLSTGSMRIQTSGDSSIGGTKQWLTSEFAMAQLLAATQMIVYGFFVAILAGMTIIRDEESKIGPLIHSGSLRAGEYIWAKFLGCLATFLFIAAAHLALAMFFFHIVPTAEQDEIVGPFQFRNYVMPMLVFGLPTIILFAGTSFAIGEWTRKPILIFALPLVFIFLFGLFFNFWSPIWLPEWANQLLMMGDPYGTRWLNETYVNVDRGVEFYNREAISFDVLFLASRMGLVAIGLIAVLLCSVHFSRQLRGARQGSLASLEVGESEIPTKAPEEVALAGDMAALQMTYHRTGFISDVFNVLRYELRELKWSPGLYLFAPFIVTQTIGQAFLGEGAFGTQILQTSGTLAAAAMNVLTLLGCVLILFYTVESQLRERVTRLAPIYYASRCGSFAILFGKALANAAVALAITLATLAACAIVLLVQGITPLDFLPFLIIWGVLLLPTYIVWCAFITFMVVVTRNRYLTYTAAAAVLMGTFYYFFRNELTWLTNWNLWNVVVWSDISSLEFDRAAFWLNRTLVLALAVSLTYLATRFYWRRTLDPVGIASKFRPRRALGSLFRSMPYVLPSVILIGVLWVTIDRGFQGAVVEKKQKDYWRQNLATWLDKQGPSLSDVNLNLDLEPAESRFSTEGTYRLVNNLDEPIEQFALTAGTHWTNIQWQLGGEDYDPTDNSRLFVFELEQALQPGESVDVGFSYDGNFPSGISKGGGGRSEFITPSSVILTNFTPSFAPVVGYSAGIGVDDENQYESRRFDKNFFEQQLDPFIGSGDRFHVHMTISGPPEFTFNSVGEKLSDEIAGGRRVVRWETDAPVRFFNVAGGKWITKEGQHSMLYYDPQHPYNVNEISAALDAARTYYSQWFAPYPWQDLRINEFANLATYAQGFPTNITFSEGIGFLTKDSPGADAAFMVTAHEAAHQWWGNLLVPGKGPGGNILSEGTAHFSTGLLFEQVKGLEARIEFFKKIEKSYNETRSPDSEKPLVWIDGSRDGDTTVTYDKGGWVFWMVLQHLGRDKCLEGIRAFIEMYRDNRDHPVLQDFVRVMRQYADDPQAFDTFANQWFFEVVVPEYVFSDLKREKLADGSWRISGSLENTGTGTMPVEIAAIRGERFVDHKPNSEFLDQRQTLQLAAGDSKPFEILCSFEPDQVLVDPDALVLQLNRKKATHKF